MALEALQYDPLCDDEVPVVPVVPVIPDFVEQAIDDALVLALMNRGEFSAVLRGVAERYAPGTFGTHREFLEAITVLPGFDDAPLTIPFMYNGKQVNGTCGTRSRFDL